MRFVGIVMCTTAVLSCSSCLAQSVATPSSDYRKLTCLELAEEGRAISKRGFMLSGLKAGLGGRNGTETAPAIVIVWPITSRVGGKQQLEDLTLALKQMDAIEQASIAGQCSIRFQRPPAT
jgi:hypothetical protein